MQLSKYVFTIRKWTSSADVVLNISVLNILIFPINFEICNILLKLDILKMVAWQLMTEKETRKEGKEEEEEGET